MHGEVDFYHRSEVFTARYEVGPDVTRISLVLERLRLNYAMICYVYNSKLRSVLRYKCFILNTYHPDTIYVKVAGLIPDGVIGIDIILQSFRSHYGPGVDSASNRNEYQEYFLGVKAAGM
jgi:hypothetical protein